MFIKGIMCHKKIEKFAFAKICTRQKSLTKQFAKICIHKITKK